MRFIAEFAKKKEDDRSIAKGITYVGGSAVIGQQTIRSGVPRLLGVRLESHSTSRKNAKEILKGGGWLDPNRGGTGASKAVNDADYIAKSKNYIHITGKHKNHKIEAGRTIYKDIDGKVTNTVSKYEDVKNNLPRDLLRRKFQRSMYRGITGEVIDVENKKGVTKAIGSILAGATGLKGRSLYIGGSDDYFNTDFIVDTDDLALKSNKKIKVHGNRASATMDALKKAGDGSRLKGVGRLIKLNPSRSLAGAGILTVGGIATTKLGQAAYKNLIVSDGRVKSHTRKNKSGKWSNIKSFVKSKRKN